MRKRGIGLDLIGWIILGMITLAIVSGAIYYLRNSGIGGLAEIFKMIFSRR